MKTVQHRVSNGDGWLLSLVQTWEPSRLDRKRRPVLIVPGYGMNSFIFSFHPRGASLEAYLVDAGLEVWRVDMRGQGNATCEGGAEDYGMEDLALTDLPVAIDAVISRTQAELPSEGPAVDVLGASLGGTLMFILATVQPAHRMGTLVGLGSPVRWVDVHPLVRILFRSRRVAGLIRLRGTRSLVKALFPIAARLTPWLLSLYINPAITEVGAINEMARTVEDPNRFINREIAGWIRQRDLVVHGVNVSEALARVTNPFLCIFGATDGIVPRETAMFPYQAIGSRTKRLIEVGSQTLSMAHADLFISNEAHERVFKPIRDFLVEEGVAPVEERIEERLD